MAWVSLDTEPLVESILIKISDAIWHQQDTLEQMTPMINLHVNGLVQDFSNSSVLAMELLQSYIKPPMRYL